MAQSRDSFTFVPSSLRFSLEEKPVSEVGEQKLLPLPAFDLDLANLGARLVEQGRALQEKFGKLEKAKVFYQSLIDQYHDALSAQFSLEQQSNRKRLIIEAVGTAIVDLLDKRKIQKSDFEQYLDFVQQYLLGGDLLNRDEAYDVSWTKSPNELYQAQSAAQLVLTKLDSSAKSQFLSAIKTYIEKQLRDTNFNKIKAKSNGIINWGDDQTVFPAITTESQDKDFQEQLKAAREKTEKVRYQLLGNSPWDNQIQNYNTAVQRLSADLEKFKTDVAIERKGIAQGSADPQSMPSLNNTKPAPVVVVPAVASPPVFSAQPKPVVVPAAAVAAVQSSEKKEEESGPQKFRRITTDLAEIAYALKGEKSQFDDKKASELGIEADKLLQEGIEVVKKIANPDERAHAAKVITERYLSILLDLEVKSAFEKEEQLYFLTSPEKIDSFLKSINDKVESLEKEFSEFSDRANQNPSRSPRLYQPAPDNTTAAHLIKEFKLGVKQLGIRLKDINDFSSALTMLASEKSNRYRYIKELAAPLLKAAAPQSGKDRPPSPSKR